MMKYVIAILFGSLLAWSAQAQTKPDLSVYLSKYQCADGRFPSYCQGERTIRVEPDTPMGYQQTDWGDFVRSYSYHWGDINDSVGVHNFHCTHWYWPPQWGNVNSNTNNGGECYEVLTRRGQSTAINRILFTRDARSVWESPTKNQYFNPCGMDSRAGWITFNNNVVAGKWYTDVFHQDGGFTWDDCSGPTNYAYTMWRLDEKIVVPWILDGNRQDLVQKVYTSWQWNNKTIAEANRIEISQYVFGSGGRFLWTLCIKGEPDFNFGDRMPPVLTTFSACPVGYGQVDYRLWTNVISSPQPAPANFMWP